MKKCTHCGTKSSLFIMNNKGICTKCDELLLDLEIELDEDLATIKKRKKNTDWHPETKLKNPQN